MKDTASYCDKTIAQTKQNIRQTETNLKNVTAKEEYFQIEEPIKTYEAKTKRLLHQHKFKKFNSKPDKQGRKYCNQLKSQLHLRNHMQMPYQVLTM